MLVQDDKMQCYNSAINIAIQINSNDISNPHAIF